MKTVLQLQDKILNSKKRITLVSVGCGAGASYGLGLKALASEEDVTIFHHSMRRAESSMRTFVGHHMDCILEISYSWSKVILKTGTVVNFCSPDSHLLNTKLVLIDDAHTFKDKRLLRHITDNAKEVVCTSKPFECGWRNPLYENGVLQKTEQGRILYTDVSWDAHLVEWGKEGELGFVGNRAKESNYKNFVEVITGFELEDNFFLMKENPCYAEVLESLPLEKRARLQGGWL
ncbi:MAG: hypothetical protein GY928_39575 [Colwellia sp.]|nr:hypothetical protein [Colwellia sp.]